MMKMKIISEHTRRSFAIVSDICLVYIFSPNPDIVLSVRLKAKAQNGS